MLGIPPSDDWLAYCVDEALHVLSSGHQARDYAWEDRFRERHEDDDGDGRNLYDEITRDPRTGKPPGRSDMAALEYAAGLRDD